MTCKLNEGITLKSETGLQLWKTWMVVVMVMMTISVGLEKVLEYKSFSLRESVL
jgi:hypothetical protein